MDEEDEGPMPVDSDEEEALADVIQPEKSRPDATRVAMSGAGAGVALKTKPTAAKAKAKQRAVKPEPKVAPTKAEGGAGVAVPAPSSPATAKASSRSGVATSAMSVEAPPGQQLDGEMQKVQDKLGPPFQVCLSHLSVTRCLSGEKLGVRLASVLRLHLIHLI